MERILKPEQKAYLILCLAMGMRDECAGKEELKTDYQITSRIYSNAFASMIRYGFPAACEARDGVAFLIMELEGCTYSCPARTVKNILKAEFATVEEKLPEVAAMVAEEESRLAAESKGRKKKGKTGASGETAQAAPEPVKKQEVQKLKPVPAPKAVQEAPAIQAPLPRQEVRQMSVPEKAAVEPAAKETARPERKESPVQTAPAEKKVQTAPPIPAERKVQAVPPVPTERKTQEIPSMPAEKEVEPVVEPVPLRVTVPMMESGDESRSGSNGGSAESSHYAGTTAVEETQLPDPAPGPLPQANGFGAPSGVFQGGMQGSMDSWDTEAAVSQKEQMPMPPVQPVQPKVPETVAMPEPARMMEPAAEKAMAAPEPAVRQTEPEMIPGPAVKPEPAIEPEKPGTREDAKAQAPHAFQRKRVQEEDVFRPIPQQPSQPAVEEREPGPVHEPEPPMQAGAEAAPSQNAAAKPLPGIFSRFLPKGKKEALSTVPAVQPMQEKATGPDVIPQAVEEEHGERICHTHYVMLKKTYGTQVTGPYTIQVWPTEVIEMHPERLPSAIFVRAQAPNGTIVCKVNEGRAKYIVLEIDNKQFNVFGFWEAGKFITEVAAINKTASIFTMSEEVEQECPEQVSDAFLDQFRSREPHRPEFFVVPVSNVIQEEGTVPIAAFIRVRDKNYPVSAKGDGNTLRFTYENVLSEIIGWWEDGKFTFAVRPVEEE